MFVELYANPSRLSIAALVVFGFELLFHVIAFCSTDWFTVTWNNKTTRVGLWRGCWHENSEEMCTASLFDTEAFNTDSGWHNGVCILMVCSLIVLVCFELVFIGYACVVRLGPYSDRLEGTLIGMLIAEVPVTGIVLLMVGTEVSMMKDGRLSWAYGLEVLCLIMSIVIVVIIYINKRLSPINNKRNQTLDLDIYKKKSIESSEQLDNPVFSRSRGDSTEYSGSAYTSDFHLSSNEFGTFDRDSVTGSVSYISDFTKSTSVVTYSKEPSRKSSLDSNVGSTSQTCQISQSPDPTQNRHDKQTQPRSLSRKSSSSIESVV